MASMLEWDSSLFNDVTPVPQDDGPDPVVPIAYTDECRRRPDDGDGDGDGDGDDDGDGDGDGDKGGHGLETKVVVFFDLLTHVDVYGTAVVKVMDLFRAFLKSNELTERALMLSEKVIRLNAANYVAWSATLLSPSPSPSPYVLSYSGIFAALY